MLLDLIHALQGLRSVAPSLLAKAFVLGHRVEVDLPRVPELSSPSLLANLHQNALATHLEQCIPSEDDPLRSCGSVRLVTAYGLCIIDVLHCKRGKRRREWRGLDQGTQSRGFGYAVAEKTCKKGREVDIF